MAWSDPFGHAQGKRIPAAQFLDRARGTGFAFCEASLGWNTDGTVIDSLRLTNWDGGYPDVFAVPDFATFRPLPWRPRCRPRHLRHRCARPQPVAAGSRAPCSSGCWLGWPGWATPPRSAWSSSSICSTRTARRSRTTSTPTRWRTPTRSIRCSPICTKHWARSPAWRASRPSTGPARWRPTWSTPTRWRPPTTAPGSSTPPRRWPAGTASSPASWPSRSPSTREAPRTCTSRCGATASPRSRPSTAPRTSWRCTRSPVCSNTCRRSRCSARTRSTPTAGSRPTRSRLRPSPGAATTAAPRCVR